MFLLESGQLLLQGLDVAREVAVVLLQLHQVAVQARLLKDRAVQVLLALQLLALNLLWG